MANIEEETIYHSFIICQTSSPQLADKFPYHILSALNQLILGEKKQQIQNLLYNYTIDCVTYNINGKIIILSNGDWLENILGTDLKDQIKHNQILNFQQIYKLIKYNIEFLYYSGEKKDNFVKIVPKFYIKHSIVFQFENDCSAVGKNVNSLLKQRQNVHLFRTFMFRSDYALLSNSHFLNSFVEGYRQMGCYIKDKHNYYFWIDPELLEHLRQLYLSAKL